jgi:hypothetical protein
LILLSIPLPNFCRSTVRSIILYVLDTIIFFKITPFLRVYDIATGMSAILFAVSVQDSWRETERSKLDHDYRTRNCLKWRAERNFWISLLSLTLWLILYRVRTLVRQAEIAAKKEG